VLDRHLDERGRGRGELALGAAGLLLVVVALLVVVPELRVRVAANVLLAISRLQPVAVDQEIGSRLKIYGKWKRLKLDVDGNAQAQALYGGAEDLNIFILGFVVFY